MTNIMMLHFSNQLFAAETALLQSSSARTVAWILGLLIVLGTAWGASVISGSMRNKKRSQQAKRQAKPADVFDEICQAQGLSDEEKRQLRDGAAILNLLAPALLFVDSSLLNKLATSDRDDAGEFRKLADRLFPPEASPSESDLAELTQTPTAVG
ncbi:MAG: hypothetical protein ISQ06_01670 [Planctomycetaceae bacterium]|jgi:hypothetical protein|nr:hypothetical protein [Planctomycetaceae bacterium]